jgi:acyl-CoA thioesterase I
MEISSFSVKLFLRTALLSTLAVLTGAPSSLLGSALIDNLNAGKDQRLVLYGTSETQFGRWADLASGHGGLADWLTKKYGSHITVINSGMAGMASNTGVAHLKGKVIAQNPDTVIIEFSINDAYTGYAPDKLDHDISAEKSKANLNTMIDQILVANPQAEIILQTMNPAWDAPNGRQHATNRPELDAYYQVYRDVAKARGLQLVDQYASWIKLRDSDPEKFHTDIPDGLHPTAPASLAVTLPTLQEALVSSGASQKH